MNDRFSARQALQSLAGNRQTKRLLRLSFPRNDGPAAIMLANHLSAHEAISRDFQFTVEVLSDDPRIPLKNVLGKLVTISLVLENGSHRYYNGHVFEFALIRSDSGFSFYRMVLMPWLAYLHLRHDNYIFHGKSLYEQTAEICRDYAESNWQTRVTGPDEPMTDAVQFGESDSNYLHRRWQARGWHYWYEHTENSHVLVLSDNTLLAEPIDGGPFVPWQDTAGSSEDDGIDQLTPVRRIAQTVVALTSFDFKDPRTVHAEMPTINQQGRVLKVESYEFAGGFGFKNQADGERMARQRIEEIEAQAKHFEASGNERGMQPGRWFSLTGHFDALPGADADQDFLVLEVSHDARNNYLQGGQPAVYRNMLTCTRKRVPWRPGRGLNCVEPKIYGLQTAIVVGPDGEEIHTDQYGRIRVQFHWDRVGQFNMASSAWVRVSSAWAGSNFGFMAVPRVGQEVLVQFLDGNPDRPLVTGRVYNARNMPPWQLPASQTQSGILSRSTKGGGYENANAIRFDDLKGAEQLWLHAEKDQLTEVENDEVKTVGRDRAKTIFRDEVNHVKNNRTEVVGNDEDLTIENNRTEKVLHEKRISIGDNRTEEVGKNESITIGDNRSVTIGGNKTETISMAKAETIGLAKALSIGLGYQTTVGAAMNTTVGLFQSEQIGQSKSTKVGASYSIEVTDELTITVGKAVLTMKSDGTISFNGHTFSVGTTGEQNYQADENITMTAKKIEEN